MKQITATLQSRDAATTREFHFEPLCLSDAKTTQLVAERIRAGIEKTKFDTHVGQLQLTMSFGVAVRDGAESHDTQALLQAAEAALYRAKAAGRNRVELASPADFEDLALAGAAPHASLHG